MKVGFTGTQEGMTGWQERRLREAIIHINPTEFHHGDCIGSDYWAHTLIRELRGEGTIACRIVIHPPMKSDKRAYCEIAAFRFGDKIEVPKDYLVRNSDIVHDTDILIATPKGMVEETRSGTWSTIRRARAHLKPYIILYPNGLVEEYDRRGNLKYSLYSVRR